LLAQPGGSPFIEESISPEEGDAVAGEGDHGIPAEWDADSEDFPVSKGKKL
jgi:hypothetical protein